VTEAALHELTRSQVPKHSNVLAGLDLFKHKVLFDGDVTLSTGLADELVDSGDELAKGFVGVDDGKFRIFPAYLARLGHEIEAVFCDKEVVVADLAVVVSMGNVEESLASIEVEVSSGWLSD